MEFQLVNGKFVQVDKSVNVVSYTWKMPEDNLNSKPRIPLMELPMMPIKEKSKRGEFARSSMVLGLATASTVATMNPENGIFWEIFMQYIYPWFLDLANVFVAIKIAQAFYQENKTGKDSGSGMGSIVVHAKWLLLFHMIPFIVKLVDEVGRRMVTELG